MRRALLLGAVAVFAAACAIPHQDRLGLDRSDRVSPIGHSATDSRRAQDPTHSGGQAGYAAQGTAGKTGLADLPNWTFAGTTGLIGEGPAGQQTVAGGVPLWTTWCDFGFDGNDPRLPVSEMEIISEIAAYLVQNPFLEIGIDGSMKGGASQSARNLSDRRAASVRDALLQAGVAAYRIRLGAFSNPDRRQEDAIQVLMKSRA